MSTIENVKATADAWRPDDVSISAALFSSIISLLEEVEVDDYPADTIQLYGFVLHSLNAIKANIDFREAFTKFFYSEDGRCRFTLHMNNEFLNDDPDAF